MRKGVEFWLRVAITLALVLLVIAAPSVLLPFIVPEKYMPCPRNTG